jgi:hypothetical protein
MVRSTRSDDNINKAGAVYQDKVLVRWGVVIASAAHRSFRPYFVMTK